MRVDLLGPLRLIVGDGEYVVTSRQPRTLLALLALHPRRVLSVDWLTEAIWEGRSRASSKNALQAAVARLRRQLRDFSGDLPLLKTSYGGYLLDIMPLDVDAFQFTTMIERATSLSRTHREQALGLITTALSLWRGPALEGTAELSMLRAEQMRLNECRVGALETAAEIRIELGLSRAVIADLRHLAETYPDRERLVELLMVALYRSGQQREALDAFHRIRTRLGDELGIDPGRGLRSVHTAILHQSPLLEMSDCISLLRGITPELATPGLAHR